VTKNRPGFNWTVQKPKTAGEWKWRETLNDGPAASSTKRGETEKGIPRKSERGSALMSIENLPLHYHLRKDNGQVEKVNKMYGRSFRGFLCNLKLKKGSRGTEVGNLV